jgi:hypothetical protein
MSSGPWLQKWPRWQSRGQGKGWLQTSPGIYPGEVRFSQALAKYSISKKKEIVICMENGMTHISTVTIQ